jgi:hypothetical protein
LDIEGEINLLRRKLNFQGADTWKSFSRKVI